ncbi:MAG: hypothetical protein ACLFQV_02605 [Vulcanimicrobiota bacterium]
MGIFQASIDPFGKVLPCSDFFDYEDKYKEGGFDWGYGYAGWERLKQPKCPYSFCCTTKKNYFFDNPLKTAKNYVFNKEIK